MSKLLFISITILLIMEDLKSSISNCQAIFTDYYQLFYYKTIGEDRKVVDPVRIKDEKGAETPGRLTFSICDTVEVPSHCKADLEKARLVFDPQNGGKCVVVAESRNWMFEKAHMATDNQIITATQNENAEPQIIYNFICKKGNYEPTIKIGEHTTTSTFYIDIETQAGCGIRLGFLKTLHEYSLITALSFTAVGIAFCFFGLKFYKDFLGVLIPLLVFIIGVYAYMVFVEKSTFTDSRPILVIAIIFSLMILVVLSIFFSNLIAVIICALSSHELGSLLHAMLANEFEIFQKEFSDWVVIIFVFLVLYAAYFYMKDYFIIFNTAVIGSFSIIIAMPYYGITDFNVLFNLQMYNFKDINEINQAFLNVMIFYVLLTMLGASIQLFLYKRDKSSYKKNNDMSVELKLQS